MKLCMKVTKVLLRVVGWLAAAVCLEILVGIIELIAVNGYFSSRKSPHSKNLFIIVSRLKRACTTTGIRDIRQTNVPH